MLETAEKRRHFVEFTLPGILVIVFGVATIGTLLVWSFIDGGFLGILMVLGVFALVILGFIALMYGAFQLEKLVNWWIRRGK